AVLSWDPSLPWSRSQRTGRAVDTSRDVFYTNVPCSVPERKPGTLTEEDLTDVPRLPGPARWRGDGAKGLGPLSGRQTRRPLRNGELAGHREPAWGHSLCPGVRAMAWASVGSGGVEPESPT